jgi:CheY-like chemotaxis protein
MRGQPGEPPVRLTVRDTGPGIPAEKLARLFTPFDRLGAEASGIEGNGLGLAIAKRLVEAMDGAIGVESSADEGTAFWIELPVASASSPPAAVAPASRAPPMPGDGGPAARLLYIEDNRSNVELIQAVLAFQPGVTLTPAANGAEGLTIAREQRPNLILLDLNLPDMHGEEVLESLRRDERTRSIPVAVVTADATPAQEEKALAGGADAYLTKPLDVQQFLTLLERLLAQARVAP